MTKVAVDQISEIRNKINSLRSEIETLPQVTRVRELRRECARLLDDDATRDGIRRQVEDALDGVATVRVNNDYRGHQWDRIYLVLELTEPHKHERPWIGDPIAKRIAQALCAAFPDGLLDAMDIQIDNGTTRGIGTLEQFAGRDPKPYAHPFGLSV